MTALDRLRAIDDKLIDLTQDGYLWLYDRTGIYLATCAATLMLAAFALTQRGLVLALVFAVYFALLGQRWLWQNRGDLNVYNIHARAMRATAWARYPFLAFMGLCMITPKSAEDSIETILLAFITGYLLAIQLRAREPKDLFERAPDLAPVRAS